MTESVAQHSPELLILSLGGSIAPLVRSITSMRPGRVCFIATAQSAAGIDGILEAVGTGIQHETIILGNGQDIARSTRELSSALDGHPEWRGLANEGRLMVDLTGGTKAMVASVALAFSPLPVKFTYVGGMERTKNGLGTVCHGSETILTCPNPLLTEDQ